MDRIIYKTDEGGAAIVIPTPEALETDANPMLVGTLGDLV